MAARERCASGSAPDACTSQYLCRTVAVYKALQLSCMFCVTAAIKCLISHENFVVDCSTVPYHSSRTLPSSFHMDRTFCWILGPGPQLARSSLNSGRGWMLLVFGVSTGVQCLKFCQAKKKRQTSRIKKNGYEGNGFGPSQMRTCLPTITSTSASCRLRTEYTHHMSRSGCTLHGSRWVVSLCTVQQHVKADYIQQLLMLRASLPPSCSRTLGLSQDRME